MKSISGAITIAVVTLGMGACESTPPQDAAIWNKPPRYGHGGTQDAKPDPAATDDQQKNRFGFAGEDPATGQPGQTGNRFGAGAPKTPPANGNLGSTPGQTAAAGDEKMAKNDGGTSKTGGGSKSSPPPSLKSYPFGKPVPGKSGFVTLPSPHDGLGEIDVRGIAPGTPVEIPDPTKPGKKIYFRVP